MPYTIGVDSGGTFTDCVVIDEEGRCTIGKAPSTPSDFAVGVSNALADAAEGLGLGLDALLAKTDILALGTTAATNALLTRRGARAGLITTAGFEDTLRIGRVRQKVAGLSERDIIHAAALDKAEPIVPYERIGGVAERVDFRGEVLTPLKPEEAAAAVRRLLDAGVEAIGVSFLWSFLNPAHEVQVREIVSRLAPDVFVSLSSELVPQMGEYERTATVALNCYLGPIVARYLASLSARLRAQGLRAPVLVMQSLGGVMAAEQIGRRAVATLLSGPVGGVMAARSLGAQLGFDRIICTDVGGTSFDVGLVVDGRPEHAREAVVDKYHTFVPMVQVSSIGTGGGSIAWIEPASGILRVGPQSAGADPGPACYGRGGTESTVTDADLVLGYLNPDNFLGGRMRLDRRLAERAIGEKIARPLGLGIVEAAAGIVRISNSQMADLVRRATIERGHDPRHFALLAYGGAGPTHVAGYGADLGVPTIVVPALAPVFSAFGVAASDLTTVHRLSDPMLFPPDLDRLNAIYRLLETQARENLVSQGITREAAEVTRSVEMRYRRQVHEIAVPLAPRALTADDLPRLVEDFERHYEALYGKGAAFREAGLELITYTVVGVGRTRKPALASRPIGSPDPSAAYLGDRPCYFADARQPVATGIFDLVRLSPGNLVPGPAILEGTSTTVVVPPARRARVDEYVNIFIEAKES